MSPFTLKTLFEKAGITIKYMWELRFSDPEISHLNGETPAKIGIADPYKEALEEFCDLTNGYFVMSDCGQLEVRCGLKCMMIRRVNDYGHEALVTFDRILPRPVHMSDTDIIVKTLQHLKDTLYK